MEDPITMWSWYEWLNMLGLEETQSVVFAAIDPNHPELDIIDQILAHYFT